MKKISVTFLYRDGANWKTSYIHEIDLEEFPEFDDLSIGDEIEMGDYGTLPQWEFYKAYAIEYDDEYDHNILKIVEINKDNK